MKKTTITLLTLLIVGSMLAACTNKPAANTTEHILRIASGYGMDEEYFREQYTELFELANENIKVEIIPTMDYSNTGRYSNGTSNDPNEPLPKTSLEIMMDLMEGPNPPDVVILGAEQMKTVMGKNLLAPLDAQIKSSKFDTTDIVPVVMDSLKSFSEDGQLYALSPNFDSPALIYNKQMFIDAGVTDLPRDKMTWDEVFALAKRLTHDEGVNHKYGFSFSSQAKGGMFYSMKTYTDAFPLQMYDDLGEKMTVDTPEWESVLTKLNQLQKDKIIPSGEDLKSIKEGNVSSDGGGDNQEGPFSYDDFMSGRVAMAIVNYGLLAQLNNANKSADTIKGYTKIEWDVVTAPSFPDAPGVVANIGLSNLMAINAKSTNFDDAWKYLEFINGEKWAQLKSHSTYQMVSLKKYIQPQDGIEFNIKAFYENIKQAPVADYNKLYRDKQNIWTIDQIGQNVLSEVITDKKTVKEALTEWQTKGDLVLQKIKENPNAPIDPSLYQSSGTNSGAPKANYGG
ncbi:ABC transporter substrate-binding protein [Paenibacillus psychroresistens]|nr:extracellular solute-binding protein [Paenibacillus psychroresistens]